MENLDFLEGTVDPKILAAFIEASEKDIILKKAIEKTTDISTFVNSILAALVCVVTREQYFEKEITKFLSTHPEMIQAIKSKQIKDTIQQQELKNE